MTAPTKPLINIDEIALEPRPAQFAAPAGTRHEFDARMGQVAPRIGGKLLGYNITSVPPGKRAFPAHSHRFNEEMFFVLEGSGELRMGDTTHPVRAGDVIACPPGGPETAHQLINTGQTELRYLAVSTKLWPEICEYPDSGKFGIMADFGNDADGKPQGFRHIGKSADARGYWEGE
jgi:uncharacterized cupin superfamily protein